MGVYLVGDNSLRTIYVTLKREYELKPERNGNKFNEIWKINQRMMCDVL